MRTRDRRLRYGDRYSDVYPLIQAEIQIFQAKLLHAAQATDGVLRWRIGTRQLHASLPFSLAPALRPALPSPTTVLLFRTPWPLPLSSTAPTPLLRSS